MPYSEREYFVSRNGLSVRINQEGSERLQHRDGRGHYFEVFDSANKRVRVRIELMAPRLIDLALQQESLPSLALSEQRLAIVALLQNLDAIAGLPSDDHGNRILELQPDDVVKVLKGPKLSDRQIRRFIVRRVYYDISRATLNEWFLLDDLDMAECCAELNDFLRAAQVLEEEGYFKTDEPGSNGFHVLPRAKLVREVERYGAAKEDVVSEHDYLASIESYKPIASQFPTIRLEYQRYGHATGATELLSVLKAVAPVVEATVKDLLRANGSRQDHASLGPAISDLQSRGIGGPVLWSELNHVLKFTRDLVGHGSQPSEPVLRIGCENAFDLLLQLAALFPR